MGAGVVKPDQHGIRIHIHTGGRSNNRMDRQSSANSKCEECTSKLSQRKILCKDCERSFCFQCSTQAVQQCKKCHILLSGNFSRPQLKEWKPKDLKALLHKHDVNTTKCREKDDLIDLIFTYFGSNPNRNRTEPQHHHNINDLTNNMRQENSSQPSSQQSSQRNPNSYTGTQSPREPTQQTQNQQGNQTNQSNQNNQSNPVNQSNQGNQDQVNVNQSDIDDGNNDEILTDRNEVSRIKLEDIRSEEHIEQLSIKCLKRLLLNNFVDYKGCCERWELQERVKRLWNDDQKNKQKTEEQRKISDNPSLATTTDGSSGNEDDICKICMDAAIDCVLLECGHMVTCTNCGKRLSECPICRQYVVRAVHIFKA